MVHELGLHRYPIHLKTFFLDGAELDPRRHIIHRHRKINRVHLHRDDLGQIHIRFVTAENYKMIDRFKGRLKEGQSLDMVPVEMAEEDIGFHRLLNQQ